MGNLKREGSIEGSKFFVMLDGLQTQLKCLCKTEKDNKKKDRHSYHKNIYSVHITVIGKPSCNIATGNL